MATRNAVSMVEPIKPRQRSLAQPKKWWEGKQTFVAGLTGGALLWAAFPPLGWSVLSWLAPIPWILFILRPSLPGKHPYVQLYVASWLTWLALLQWMRLPHWATSFGWLALSLYLAIYLPVFMAVTRHMVKRWRFPVWLGAPVVWTGLELARAWLFTGFAMLLLGHTQAQNAILIQIADLAGAYGVGFVMVMAAAVIACWMSTENRRHIVLGTICIVVLFAAVWFYGASRRTEWATTSPRGTADTKSLRVGLVQGAIDTRFDDPSPPRVSYDTYLQLSRDAVAHHPDLQLLIWPESMYWQYDEPFPTGLTLESNPSEFRKAVAAMGEATAAATVKTLGVPCLVGCAVFEYVGDEQQRFNSILMIDDQGNRLGRYDKMHPVMFGEYVPFGDIFPWLYAWTPMGAGLTAGVEPACFEVNGVKFCPNICFENTVPQLIRRQVRELIAEGQSPDVLVTATNDGWFWGSSLLDHHLSCGIFRAVEMRRPMLIAANTGFSAWIDAAGQVRKRGPRRAEGLVIADVAPRTGNESVYLRWGDLLPTVCLLVVLAAATDAVRVRRSAREIARPDSLQSHD